MDDSYEYEDIQSFSSYKNKFDMVIYDSEKGNQVEDEFVKYCKGSKTHHLYNISEYINLCVRINRYFKMISNENNPNNKHCEYLNYWLNDQYKKNKTNILYKSILDTPESFHIFDKSIPHIDTYKKKIGHIEDDIFKRIDVIHDLYKEYGTFLLLLSRENTRNQSCNLARKCSKLYNDNIGDCHDSNNKFCKALESFKQKYSSHGISIKICADVPQLNTAQEAYQAKIQKVAQEKHKGNNPSLSTTITVVFINLILIISLTLIMYKFTPFGSFLRHSIRKKKTMKNKLNYEKNDLILSDSLNNYRNSEYRSHNVQYHSILH